jgi:putative ABC transport system substrate-binding protein
MPEIGVLIAGRAEDLAEQALLAAFRSGLEAFGWDEAKTIHIAYRWGDADDDRIRAHAAELARLAPKVILTYGAPAIVALKHATSTIPIVFAGSSDPVGVPAVGRHGAHPLPVVIGPMLDSERTERTRAAAFRLMSCRKASHQMAGGGTFPAARLDPLADDARQISP